ncbi:MAG: hypothetical protein WAL66_02245, partial [Nitrososphaeraceae archaeon]
MATKLGTRLKKNDYIDLRICTYLYELWPLANTLDKYIDYKKLNPAATKERLPEVLLSSCDNCSKYNDSKAIN